MSKKVKTTNPTPEPTLSEAIRAKAHSLQQTAIEELWEFVTKPDKTELGSTALEHLNRLRISPPRPLLVENLSKVMLQGLDAAMRLTGRPRPAEPLPSFGPFTTGNPPPNASRAREQPTRTDPDLLAERLLKAIPGKKK